MVLGTWGIILAALTLALSVGLHLFRTTWIMAEVTTILKGVKDAVEKIEGRLAHYEASHLSKEDAYREIGRLELKADAAHMRIDNIQKLVLKDKGI